MALDDKIIQYQDGTYYEVLDAVYAGEGNTYYLCRDIKTLKCSLIYPGDVHFIIDDRTHFVVIKNGIHIISRNDIETLYKMLPNKTYPEKVVVTPALIKHLEKTYGFNLNDDKLISKGGTTVEMDTYQLWEQLFEDYAKYKRSNQ